MRIIPITLGVILLAVCNLRAQDILLLNSSTGCFSKKTLRLFDSNGNLLGQIQTRKGSTYIDSFNAEVDSIHLTVRKCLSSIEYADGLQITDTFETMRILGSVRMTPTGRETYRRQLHINIEECWMIDRSAYLHFQKKPFWCRYRSGRNIY